MQYNTNMSKIYQAKGLTLIEQYFDVGTLFAKSIRKAVAEIEKKRTSITRKRKLVAEKVWARLYTNPLLCEFGDCLAAWSKGAGITIEQAMWLVADNFSGCQTLMVRYKSGVALLHTEEDFEDPKRRMTAPHTIEFEIDGESVKTLIYNDIFPGAGLYGWKKDLLIAVDSLFLREDDIEKVDYPMLANIVSWLMWRMSVKELDPHEIVVKLSGLGELVDGYVVNVVRKVGGKVQGYKLSFARHDWEVEKLGKKIGASLRQVNILEPHYVGENRLILQWQAPREQIEDYWAFYLRLQVMGELVKKYEEWFMQELGGKKIHSIHLVIMKLIFEIHRTEFVNHWMAAACVGILDQTGMSVSMKLNDNKPVAQVEYIDQL